MPKNWGSGGLFFARELGKTAILEIKKMVGLELEVFVHGALCICYSGQCLMSSLIGGRSGNRGRCAQPCRQPYTLLGMGAPGEYVLSPAISASSATSINCVRPGLLR